MPRGDRTGPEGIGPMTGRGAGYCAGNGAPGYAGPAQGGRGFGHGRGMFRGGYAPRQRFWNRSHLRWPVYSDVAPPYYPEKVTREEELSALKDQVKYMEEDISATQKRIAELEKEE